MIAAPMDDVNRQIEKDGSRDLRGRLAHYFKQTGMVPLDLAIAIGGRQELVPSITGFMDGKPTDDELVDRLSALLGHDPHWQPDPVANLRMVFEMCRHVAKRGRVGAISGRAGYAKTSSLKTYARIHGAAYYAYDEVSGPRIVIRELCRLTGAHGFAVKNMGDMLHVLIEHLRRRPRTLLIDQADTLPFKALEAIRAIHDATGCPLILAGLEGRLMGRLLRRNERENAEQIFSRITAHITLPVPTVEDVQMIAGHYGIKAARSIEFIHRRAAVGGYRTIRTLCEDAADVAANNGTKIPAFEHVKLAASYLITTVRDEEAAA